VCVCVYIQCTCQTRRNRNLISVAQLPPGFWTEIPEIPRNIIIMIMITGSSSPHDPATLHAGPWLSFDRHATYCVGPRCTHIHYHCSFKQAWSDVQYALVLYWPRYKWSVFWCSGSHRSRTGDVYWILLRDVKTRVDQQFNVIICRLKGICCTHLSLYILYINGLDSRLCLGILSNVLQ